MLYEILHCYDVMCEKLCIKGTVKGLREFMPRFYEYITLCDVNGIKPSEWGLYAFIYPMKIRGKRMDEAS